MLLSSAPMVQDATLYEMLLRGVAIGALTATIIGWQRGGVSRDARIAGLLFLFSVIGFALNDAPALRDAGGNSRLATLLAVTGPATLWALCMVLFEDRRMGLPILAPAIAIVACALAAMVVRGPLSAGLWILGNLLGAGLCLHVLVVLLRGWRGDLVEARRRLRGPLMAAVALYCGLQSWMSVGENLGVAHSSKLENGFVGAVILAVLTLSGAAVFLRGAPSLFEPVRRPAAATAAPAGLKAQDRQALDRLKALMEDSQVWRREGLTIGDVAREVAVPEHRLRRLINDQLGHRNFAAFLNARRIEAAKALLAQQSGAAISSLAFDLGYASLGPFNRAFKDATGVTPSEFRRRAVEAALPIS
jgi:AraC-like DNA-binding protein